MRKLLKNKKALSPVVAAIILIAVTVAVSIAVAAWMGSLTIGFMETSELVITNIAFDSTNNNMTLSLANSGTSTATISQIRINGNTVDMTTEVTGDATYGLSFDAGASGSIEVDETIVDGNKYSVSLFAKDGTMIGSFTSTA